MTHPDRAALLMEVIPRMMRIIRTEFRAEQAGNLTLPQLRLLGRVAREPASNQELADWMGVSAPSMSKMVDGMTRRGLLTRRTGTGDRRQVQVRCSAKGLELAGRMRANIQDKLSRRMENLPEPAIQAIESGLIALRETLMKERLP